MSDHFSGPRAMAGPFCDITDAYAFPSPERPGKLVLVMNVLPLAKPNAMFSDAVACRFRLRPLTIEGKGPGATFRPSDKELAVDCVFDPPGPALVGAPPRQTGRVVGPTGETVSFTVHDAEGVEASGMRVFAGLRSDPFFVDFDAAQVLLKAGQLAFTNPGKLKGPGANVLSLVIEVDSAPLVRAAGSSLFAVVAETISAGKLPVRLERVGRPEIKNMVLSMKHYDQVNRDLEVRDLYNLEDAFHIGPDYRNAYRARFDANLAVLDKADGKVDWQPNGDGVHPLTELLLGDFLVIDVAKPFAEGSFLEIEKSVVAGRPYTSAGGRPLNDDIVDTLFTFIITAGQGAPVSQHLAGATQRAVSTFPYLAPPNRPSGIEDPHANDRGGKADHDAHSHHQFGRHGF